MKKLIIFITINIAYLLGMSSNTESDDIFAALSPLADRVISCEEVRTKAVASQSIKDNCCCECKKVELKHLQRKLVRLERKIDKILKHLSKKKQPSLVLSSVSVSNDLKKIEDLTTIIE